MKSLLKNIRSWPLVNVPVRSIVRACFGSTGKVHDFFTKHWPVSGTIRFDLPGGEKVKLWSKSDDYISTQAYWNGFEGYEGASSLLFYQLSKKENCIVDIGANIGFFSLVAAAANPNAKVIAFEPVPRIAKRLEKNILINGFANVTAEACAVGNTDGEIPFFLFGTEGMSLASSAKKGWGNNTTETKIPSVTLDSYQQNKKTGRIGLIKMDCELHEKEALQGMSKILEKDKPVLLTEILFPESDGVKPFFETTDYAEIESMMRHLGYHFYRINSNALIRVDKLEFNPDDRNYLFSVKKSGKEYLPYSDMPNLLQEIL